MQQMDRGQENDNRWLGVMGDRMQVGAMLRVEDAKGERAPVAATSLAS